MADGRHHHPGAEQLRRFLLGEATVGETREVVRHLLTGCRQCQETAEPLLADRRDSLRRHGRPAQPG